MHQTAYRGIRNLYKGNPILGGICRFWFIPIEEVASIPVINPISQYLIAEPVLLNPNGVWRGPVPVPDAQLGLTEKQETSGAGPYWKVVVAGQSPGESARHRVNFDNMAYGKYLVVAQLRASENKVLIGSLDSPLDFDQDYSNGPGSAENAKTKISFFGESIYRALILPAWDGIDSGVNFGPIVREAGDNILLEDGQYFETE